MCACVILSSGLTSSCTAHTTPVKSTVDATTSTYDATVFTNLATESTLAAAPLTLGITGAVAVVGVVIYFVLLRPQAKSPQGEPGEAEPPAGSDEGAGLIAQGFVGGGGALAFMAGYLVQSPSAMDALTSQAAAGRGARLDALAGVAGLPPDVVASAWLDTAAAPAATREEAFAGVVRFIRRIGPALRPDPVLAERLLRTLAAEQASPDFPANAPTHALVAALTGLAVADVAPVVAQTLMQPDGRPMARADLHADPVELAEHLGRNLGTAHPVAVSAQVERLLAAGTRHGVPDERVAAAAR